MAVNRAMEAPEGSRTLCRGNGVRLLLAAELKSIPQLGSPHGGHPTYQNGELPAEQLRAQWLLVRLQLHNSLLQPCLLRAGRAVTGGTGAGLPHPLLHGSILQHSPQ